VRRRGGSTCRSSLVVGQHIWGRRRAGHGGSEDGHSGGEDDDRERGGGFENGSAELGGVRQVSSDADDDLDSCTACASQITTETPEATT
jgi:hypothetical protein